MIELEIGKVYKSLAGCPVKLLRLLPNAGINGRELARVEYVDEVNHYGYGKGAIGMFYASDLREWDGDSPNV